MSSLIKYEELEWDDRDFRILTDDDPHGKLFIITPNGQMIDVGCHADPEIDVNRAMWICDVLNAARSAK